MQKNKYSLCIYKNVFIHHSNQTVRILSKMTEAQQYFVSPFQEIQQKNQSQSESWRPAFPDQPQEEEVKAMTVQSSSNRIQQQKPSIIEQDISFQDDLDLSGLQNIDIQIPQYKQKQKERPRYEQIDEAYDRFISDGIQKKLQTKQYEGNHYDQQWMRRLDKTIAARAFVYRGYGINYLKEELRSGNYDRFALDQSKYKSISGSMAREAYRKLQSFLLRDCKRKLHNLSGYQMKLLQTLLLNCRSTLNPFASNCFIQVVKVTYTLEDSKILQTEAAALYDAIYRALQKKISILRGGNSMRSDQYSQRSRFKGKHFQSNFRPRFIQSDVLSPSMEKEVIRQYINQHSLSRIRDILRSQGLISDYITTKTIRNVLRRVLRSTIRKIQNILNDGVRDYRYFNKMSDQQIKWVLQVAEGLQARKQLCRVHLQERQDRKFLQSVYRELRILIQRRDSRGSKIQVNLI